MHILKGNYSLPTADYIIYIMRGGERRRRKKLFCKYSVAFHKALLVFFKGSLIMLWYKIPHQNKSLNNNT